VRTTKGYVSVSSERRARAVRETFAGSRPAFGLERRRAHDLAHPRLLCAHRPRPHPPH
jgi:hypothetical protein